MLETTVTLIERADIECPMKYREVALEILQENGYTLLRSGPREIVAGSVDINVFHAAGEKTLQSKSINRKMEEM